RGGGGGRGGRPARRPGGSGRGAGGSPHAGRGNVPAGAGIAQSGGLPGWPLRVGGGTGLACVASCHRATLPSPSAYPLGGCFGRRTWANPLTPPDGRLGPIPAARAPTPRPAG